MFQDIPLVADGKAFCSIATPDIYHEDALRIQGIIEQKTGVVIPVISDKDPGAAVPFTGNLIILGNRSTSGVSSELYDRFYSLADLKYPGPGGYAVRTLHNPFGNGYSAVLVGGSDAAGVYLGSDALAAEIAGLPASPGNMSIGWTMLTRTGEGLVIPTDIKNFEIWEASKGYGSTGYFGWNSISKRMAMYYMTGDPFQAREVVRLSFPDAQAIKEIEEIDGERIENKKDPLAGPYHYNAMMLILFWDLIEESPVFSDAEKLKITNAFARRLDHEGTTPYDKTTYKTDAVPSSVGSRHGQWSALSLYTLGRYFNKYYPSPMWAQAERAGQLSFASLHNHSWVSGENDNLYWYNTAIAPVLTYMILSGDRIPLQNGVLQELLHGQEVLISGLVPDWALNYAAIDFLNKAAYLTGDGRWINYRERTGVNTDIFRLGQSFWPDSSITPSQPEDLRGRWLVNYLPEPMWKSRKTGFTREQSFMNMSFRNTSGASGDYILLDGLNGASRNPYHTFDILELRLNGLTMLKGYNNQVISTIDGEVSPVVPMDGALIFSDVIGEFAVAVGSVPLANWKRSIVQHIGKTVLIADEMNLSGNRKTGSDITVRMETSWEIPGATWIPQYNFLRFQPSGGSSQVIYELLPSEIMEVRAGSISKMTWQTVSGGEKDPVIFHLIGQNNTGSYEGLACLRITDNAASLALPEAAVAVAGNFQEIKGDLVILGEKTIFGRALLSAGLDQSIFISDVPVEVFWDHSSAAMDLVTGQTANIKLLLTSPDINVNGTTVSGLPSENLFSFTFTPGRYSITGAAVSAIALSSLKTDLRELLSQAKLLRTEQMKKDSGENTITAPSMEPVFRTTIGASPNASTIISSGKENILCVSAGKSVYWISSEGKTLRRLTTEGNVKVLHWWDEAGLLLAGCADEKVIAFDQHGQRKWDFTSVMDPAVYEAAKDYWFKSTYPGVYGLYSGNFDGGRSRAFVGSACTLEILDEQGKLVKRMPVFWGNARQFLIVNATDNSKNLLVGCWENGTNDFAIISSKTLSEAGRGYNGVPSGHTSIGGWMAMNRFDNYLADLEGDGSPEVVSAINGVWNRVTIYSETGTALFNKQFGPGVTTPRANLRMMDVGDINRDGKMEIITALSSGMIHVMNHKAEKLWTLSLLSPPMVVKTVSGSCDPWLCVGCEDGTVLVVDGRGNIFKQAEVSGKPVDLKVMKSASGPVALMMTDKGQISGFRIFCGSDVLPSDAPFTLFPNPATDRIEINFRSSYMGTIYVFDDRGRLVLAQKGNGKSNQISTGGWQKGMYFIKINLGEKDYFRKVVVM